MLKYILNFAVYIIVQFLMLFLTPLLPWFATMKFGPINNNNAVGFEPRLPKWLNWFMTQDNSLWGDEGWQTIHCPDYKSYFGMTKWLYRNSCQGLSWSVLSFKVNKDTVFTYTHSGDDLKVDKNKNKSGWFYIKSPSGAFHFRFVKVINDWIFSCEFGWLLDTYVKNKDFYIKNPYTLLQVDIKMPKILEK